MPIFRSRRRVAVLAAVVGLGSATAYAATSAPTPAPVAAVLAWTLGGRYLGQEGVRMQEGAEDCGVAALAMVLEHHGRVPRLEEARRQVLERGAGLTLLEMQGIAGEHGLGASGWRLESGGLERAPLPAVAHFEDHYVVVDSVGADGTVHLRDPSIGRMELSGDRFRRLWTGNVLLFGAGHGEPAPKAPFSQ